MMNARLLCWNLHIFPVFNESYFVFLIIGTKCKFTIVLNVFVHLAGVLTLQVISQELNLCGMRGLSTSTGHRNFNLVFINLYFSVNSLQSISFHLSIEIQFFGRQILSKKKISDEPQMGYTFFCRIFLL